MKYCRKNWAEALPLFVKAISYLPEPLSIVRVQGTTISGREIMAHKNAFVILPLIQIDVATGNKGGGTI